MDQVALDDRGLQPRLLPAPAHLDHAVRARTSRLTLAVPPRVESPCAVSSGRGPRLGHRRGRRPPGRGSFRRTSDRGWCPVAVRGRSQRAMTRVRRRLSGAPAGSRSGRAGSRTRTSRGTAPGAAPVVAVRARNAEGRPRWRSRRGARRRAERRTRTRAVEGAVHERPERALGQVGGPATCGLWPPSAERQRPADHPHRPHPLPLPVITPRRIRSPENPPKREGRHPRGPLVDFSERPTGGPGKRFPHTLGEAGGYKGGLTRRPPGEVVHGTRREGITAGPSGGRACAASVRRGP
ncbi:hypothetical protein SHIRM173S_10802 [Streptomyces hirsutus]